MNRIPFKEIGPLLKVAVQNWQNDRAPRMGAALAYYIALSLAPTLLILLAIAGLAFGAQAAEGRLVSQIQGLVGYDGAAAIQTMIEGARRSSGGIAATVLGLVTVFFAASAVVSELRDAMNTIWRVPEDTTSSAVRSIFNLVKERLLSFALVLASGLFLVASPPRTACSGFRPIVVTFAPSYRSRHPVLRLNPASCICQTRGSLCCGDGVHVDRPGAGIHRTHNRHFLPRECFRRHLVA
jgi:uncharacterized BrkB/YihY/UPF0761 family membrane protein